MKNTAKTLSRVCLGAVVFLLLLELVIRLLGAAPPKPKIYADDIYVPDPHLPYHQKPLIARDVLARSGEFREVFRHNTAGFRDVEHDREKPPGTFRILAVGGSLTYGTSAPFEQTYLSLLERDLNGAKGRAPAVEIIKAGIGGFFPEAERLLVEHYGLAYDPDLLLVAFDETDLFDTFLGVERLQVSEGFLKTAEMRELGRVLTFFSVHTHVGRILFHRWSQVRFRRLDVEFREHIGETWVRAEAEILRMKALVEGAGGRIVVSYTPLGLDRSWEELVHLEGFCRKEGIPLIDTTAALEEASRDGAVFWEQDGHVTPLGYGAIATALGAFLTEGGYLP